MGSTPGEAERPSDNLPLKLTSFVGREREISEVKRLLGETRLLTLTGPGGCGKTRLALRVTEDLKEGFEDGAWWVGLASLSDPDLVAHAVASVFEVHEAPGRSLSEMLAGHLVTKQTLLVLDNCEHLVEACAALVDTQLRACPHLRVLATSRQAMGVAGETIWPVPPLSAPDPRDLPPVEELKRYEAVRLFVERARSVVPSFELGEENAGAVGRVCARLEGIPLAVELAAARVRVLSVEQILKRLEDNFGVLKSESRTADPRQQTLRATIDWSHELLGQDERRLFRRLSVFAGSFSLEAAEEVCAGEGVEKDEVLDLLTRLVGKSLALVVEREDGQTRYRLLETVRQYGQEKLDESGEAEALRGRHAAFFLALAEEAEPGLWGVQQGEWLERLELEHENLRAALSWALEGGQTELGLRIGGALGEFWYAHGHLSEGRRWLEMGLAGSSATSPSVRAKALNRAGWIAIFQGDDQAIALLEESLSLYKELEDRAGIAVSLASLGWAVLNRRNVKERLTALREEAEALRREPPDRWSLAHLLTFLGLAALEEGDHERAVTIFEESLSLFREVGDVTGTVICLNSLGMAASERGDHERAVALFEEALRVLRTREDRVNIANSLMGLALAVGARGQPARAARLWGAAEALREAIGSHQSGFESSHPDHEGRLAATRAQLDEAAWGAAWSEGRAMTLDEAIEYALSEPSPPSKLPQEEGVNRAGLSERELEVLRLVAEGLTDPQVAQRLYLSPRTVGWHLRSIYRKLGVPSRAAATKEAVDRGLI